MNKNNPSSDPLSFESALKRLEEIVHLLEEGDIGLSESLERYEEGVKLLRQSYDLLQRAERRIEILERRRCRGEPDHAALRRYRHVWRGGAEQTPQPASVRTHEIAREWG